MLNTLSFTFFFLEYMQHKFDFNILYSIFNHLFQTSITIDINDLPINYALLQLVSSNTVNSSEKKQMQLKLRNNFNLLAEDFHHYTKALGYVEDIALYLKPFSSGLYFFSFYNFYSVR